MSLAHDQVPRVIRFFITSSKLLIRKLEPFHVRFLLLRCGSRARREAKKRKKLLKQQVTTMLVKKQSSTLSTVYALAFSFGFHFPHIPHVSQIYAQCHARLFVLTFKSEILLLHANQYNLLVDSRLPQVAYLLPCSLGTVLTRSGCHRRAWRTAHWRSSSRLRGTRRHHSFEYCMTPGT